MIKKLILTAITTGMLATFAIPMTSVFADTTQDNTSEQTSAVQFTGELPAKVTTPTKNIVAGHGDLVSNGILQKVNTPVGNYAGDVQTGVAAAVTPQASAFVAIIGALMAVVAGYMSGLRIKLYRKEN